MVLNEWLSFKVRVSNRYRYDDEDRGRSPNLKKYFIFQVLIGQMIKKSIFLFESALFLI